MFFFIGLKWMIYFFLSDLLYKQLIIKAIQKRSKQHFIREALLEMVIVAFGFIFNYFIWLILYSFIYPKNVFPYLWRFDLISKAKLIQHSSILKRISPTGFWFRGNRCKKHWPPLKLRIDEHETETISLGETSPSNVAFPMKS